MVTYISLLKTNVGVSEFQGCQMLRNFFVLLQYIVAMWRTLRSLCMSGATYTLLAALQEICHMGSIWPCELDILGQILLKTRAGRWQMCQIYHSGTYCVIVLMHLARHVKHFPICHHLIGLH